MAKASVTLNLVFDVVDHTPEHLQEVHARFAQFLRGSQTFQALLNDYGFDLTSAQVNAPEPLPAEGEPGTFPIAGIVPLTPAPDPKASKAKKASFKVLNQATNGTTPP